MATELTPEFKKYGDTFTLIQEEPNVACIYERTNKERKRPSYEVWKLRLYKSDSALYQAKIGDLRTPGTTDWGTYGWTYNTLKEAKTHFNQLVKEHADK